MTGDEPAAHTQTYSAADTDVDHYRDPDATRSENSGDGG